MWSKNESREYCFEADASDIVFNRLHFEFLNDRNVSTQHMDLVRLEVMEVSVEVAASALVLWVAVMVLLKAALRSGSDVTLKI